MVKKLLDELIQRWDWSKKVNRIGPDILYSQVLSYAPKLYKAHCAKIFGKFDDGAEIRPNAIVYYCSNVFLGKNVVLRPNSILMAASGAQIIIEDDVLIGPGVHIYVSNHSYDNKEIPIYYQGHEESKTVKLETGCWIGANAIILPGVTIGKNAVVAAGSIVTKNVPDYSVVAGVPAKVIKVLE